MKIFVYDNNPELKELYEAILQPIGADMTFFDQLEDAREEAVTGSYDVMLWDIGFPTLDGLLVAEELVRIFPGQPVILICGVPISPSAMDYLVTQPFQGVLSKPFDIQRLRYLVQWVYRNTQSSRPRSVFYREQGTLRAAV